ncbi:MAG: hypothetical protein V4555_03130 [Acidobacteriota bacterium]
MRCLLSISQRTAIAIRSQSGQNLLEHALILMLVALMAIAFSQFPTTVFNSIGNMLTSFV